jgi:protein subunit release factor B
MTPALKVFLQNEEFALGTPFPSKKLLDAREKSQRARLQLKNAKQHMLCKESELAINFTRGPSSVALRTTLNSRYIKAASRVRTLRKYVAYIDNQVEREEVERNNDDKIAEYFAAGGLVA